MSLRIYIILVFIVGLPILSFSQQKESVNVETNNLIINLTMELAKSWEELNIEKYLNYFSPDLVFYIEGDCINYNTLEEHLRLSIPNLKETTFEIIDPVVHQANNDLAIISCKLKETFLDKNDNYDEITGAMTLVWEKNNGKWMIAIAHESFPPITNKN